MRSISITLASDEAETVLSALEQLRGRAYSAGELELYEMVDMLVRKYDDAAKRLREE